MYDMCNVEGTKTNACVEEQTEMRKNMSHFRNGMKLQP
jgi:hypothetical protein